MKCLTVRNKKSKTDPCIAFSVIHYANLKTNFLSLDEAPIPTKIKLTTRKPRARKELELLHQLPWLARMLKKMIFQNFFGGARRRIWGTLILIIFFSRMDFKLGFPFSASLIWNVLTGHEGTGRRRNTKLLLWSLRGHDQRFWGWQPEWRPSSPRPSAISCGAGDELSQEFSRVMTFRAI